MGFKEKFGYGKNKNMNPAETITANQNNTDTFTLPAITALPAGFKIGDNVKIKTICNRYRDSNWKLQYISTGTDVNLKLHHDEIVFEITSCRDNLLELTAYAYGTHYLIYVSSDMIQMNKEPNKDNNLNNYRNYDYGTYSLPDGFNIGDSVKLKEQCNRYYDEHLKRHSIDFDTDMYFKNNFSSIIFKITGSKGNYLELTARENGRNYVIYVSPEVTQLYKERNEDNSYNNSSYNYENSNSDSYSYGNANEDSCEYAIKDYDDSLSYIPIDDYVYSSVEEVDEWCRTTEYDDGDISWTNDFDILQSFYHDVDEMNYFSSRLLLSMLYPDIYLPNAVKEKAFRILLYRAHHGDAESQYWVGVAAYQGLVGRESDKRVAYIYIKLAELNGFGKTDGYRKWLRNPTSKYIAQRFSVNTSLFYTAEELNAENESDYSYNDDNYDYNSYDNDDDYDYNSYDDDDDDYDYGNYGSDSYKRGIGNGDTVRINPGVNRYWTDLYNKNSRVNGIPSDYFSKIWTVVNNDGNKYELEFISGLIIKKTVRIVLCLQDITET